MVHITPKSSIVLLQNRRDSLKLSHGGESTTATTADAHSCLNFPRVGLFQYMRHNNFTERKINCAVIEVAVDALPADGALSSAI